MALPRISTEGVIEFVKETIEKSTRTIVDGFAGMSERIVDSVTEKARAVKNFGFGDAASWGLAGSFFDKIGDRLSSVLGIGTNQKRLEDLLSDIRDATSERLDSLNKNFKDFIREWKLDNEKRNGVPPREEEAPPGPAPEPERRGGWFNWILLFFKDLASMALRAVSIAAIGAAITGSIVDGIKKWNIGEEIGNALGLNDGVGGILNILIGNAEETFMQKLARYGTYATAGATIGMVGGIPGMIVGGIIGLATGVILDWITDWIGKDKIYQFVDRLTDKFFSGLDFILGTDVERLESRIKDLTRGKGDIETKILFKQKQIQELEGKIAKARMEGREVEVQKLTRALEETKKDLADYQSQYNDYDRRIGEMRFEIKNKQKNLIDKLEDFGSLVVDYIYTIPRRVSDSVLALFTGERIDEIWAKDKEDLFTNGITTRLENAAVTFVSDFVNGVVDKVVEFFTVTIPKAFDDIGDIIQKKFSDAYDKLVNFASTFADEISYKDFLPEYLGGNDRSLYDRVQEKIKEQQKQTLIENDKMRSGMSDSIVDNSSKITNNNNNSSNTVNAPIMNQQNVVNKNMTRAPNYSKNLDSTARALELDSRGVPIGP